MEGPEFDKTIADSICFACFLYAGEWRREWMVAISGVGTIC